MFGHNVQFQKLKYENILSCSKPDHFLIKFNSQWTSPFLCCSAAYIQMVKLQNTFDCDCGLTLINHKEEGRLLVCLQGVELWKSLCTCLLNSWLEARQVFFNSDTKAYLIDDFFHAEWRSEYSFAYFQIFWPQKCQIREVLLSSFVQKCCMLLWKC